MKGNKGKSNQWVKEAMAGKYEYNTGGAAKKGRRPGFSKAGSATEKHEKKMKGMTPTHGTDGMC
jgi:hypothetical protein